MEPSRFRRLRELFAAVVDLPPVSRRSRLGVLAADDPSLVDEVLALVDAHAKGERTFLDGVGDAVRQVEAEGGTASSESEDGDARMRRLRDRQADTAHRYRHEDEIGRGGMGRVLRVRDLDLRRDLAMKVVRGGAGDAVRARRFLDEAEITGQLDHPGVVPVHDLGVDAEGQLFFTMRIVRGDTVDVAFAAARAGTDGWTRTRALEVVLRVCDTMAFAHDKGVIHRDLKPSNVMVGKFGEVYVVDWGLAKVVGKNDAFDLRVPSPNDARGVVATAPKETRLETTTVRTMDGTVMGTPSFMPPEQALGHVAELDHRADVYAIGAILYQLLTGQMPYAAVVAEGNARTVVEAVRAGAPVPVRTIDPMVPKELAAVCAKAMARDLEARYQSVRDLAADLRAYLDQRVVQAYRTGLVVRMRLWLRRNRTLSITLGAAAIVALVAFFWVRLERLDREASDRQAAADRLDREDAKRREVSAKQAAARQQRRVREAASLGGEQRKVLDLVQRLLAADDRIVALACAAEVDADGNVDDPALAAALELVGREVRGDDPLAFEQWVSARFQAVCGAESPQKQFRYVPPKSKDEGDPILFGDEEIVRDKRPEGSLFFALRAQVTAAEYVRRRQWQDAVVSHLEALDELRLCARDLRLEAVDRGALRVLAVDVAQSLAITLSDPECTQDAATLARVETWLAKVGAPTRGRDAVEGGALDPELSLERSAVFARRGRIDEALVEAERIAAAAPLARWRAELKLRQGSFAEALAMVRAPDRTRVDALHEFARIEARIQALRQRPYAAIEVLQRDLERLPAGGAFAALRVESLEQVAKLAEWVGDVALATTSLQAACDLVAAHDPRRVALRLQLARARQIAGESIAQELEGMRDAAEKAGSGTSQAFARLALRVGRPDLAETGSNSWGSGPEATVLAMTVEQVRSSVSKATRDAVARFVAQGRRETLPAAACLTGQLLLVRSLVAEGNRPDAWKGLEQAAALFERRLGMYAWYGTSSRGEDPLDVDDLLADARSALDLLAQLVPVRDDGEMATAWSLLVGTHRLRERLGLMRSFDFVPDRRSRDSNPRTSTALDVERHWLGDGRLSLPAPDLSRSIERLRSDSPQLASLQWPRLPKLRELQSALPGDTALVLMFAAPVPMVAVVGRRTAELVTTPLSAADVAAAGLPATAVASSTFGATLLAPAVQLAGVRKLVLLPDDPWLAVPFEWCPMPATAAGASPQPLLARFDVGYAHAVDLWLESSRSNASQRSSAGVQGFVQAEKDGIANGWARAALMAGVAEHYQRELLGRPFPDGEHSHYRVCVRAGSRVTSRAISESLAMADVAAFSLPILEAGRGAFARFELPGQSDAFAPQDAVEGVYRCGSILLQAPADQGDLLIDRARALAAFARALTVSGAHAIWTVPEVGEPAPEASRRLREAMARKGDPVTAWCQSLRDHAAAGGDPAIFYGVRLWAGRQR